jgi:uncharacterized protein
MPLTVAVAGQPLELWPQRAAFLPDQGLLLVADAHFGKAQSFRRLGVPVPEATTAANLQTLTTLVAATRAREVVFLGDLLHARHGRAPATMAAVARWRAEHAAVAMRLVRGNHDSRAGDPPSDWQVEVVDEPWRAGAYALCHHPDPVDGAYVLAGHLHPAFVAGRGIDRLRLPCFHFGASVGVLPAFGAFTGMHAVTRMPGDRIFVIGHDEVRAMPA